MRQPPVLLTVVLLLASVAGAATVPADVSQPSNARPSASSPAASSQPAASPSSVAAGASVASLEQAETLTNVLTVAQPRRSNATQSESNLSAGVAMRADRLDQQLARRSLSEKLSRMNDTDRKKRFIRHTNVELTTRTEALRAAERRAYTLHSQGQISSRELLIRLARVHRTAGALSRNATIVQRVAADVEGLNVNGDLGALKLELQTLRGPVRDRVAETLRGDAPPTRVYVQTADRGVVLSSIVDDRYVREVYDGTRRTTNRENKIQVDRVSEVLQQSYPIIYQRSNGRLSTLQDQVRESSIFGAQMQYRDGSLVAYIDRGNAKVFREEQHLRLNRSPPTTPRTVTQSNLELTVYPSYPGGPAMVEVVDARTGDPVSQAKVTFTSLSGGGRTSLVGQTGRQGRLWAVMPNETVRVNVIHPDRNTKIAAVRVSPVEPLQVRADDDNVMSNESGSASVATTSALRAG